MQTIQLKRGKALCLAELNPKPEAGELIFEIDTGHFKIGDGIRRWNSLPYADRAGAHTHVVGDILGLQTVLDNKQVVGNYVVTNDSRLTDARVPVAHAGTHAANGSDPITISATQVTGLATVATSGSYTDLTNLPTLFDGAYSSLTGAPILATVATSGSYNDLSDKPTNLSTDWSDITNKPDFATVATSGSYTDLTNLPALFDGAYSSLTGAPILATVATSGAYEDLSGSPTLATVATSGSYTDLTDTPAEYVLPTATETVLGGVKIGAGVSIADGVISVSTDYAATSHTHGNITNDGKIGTAADKIIVTTEDGVLIAADNIPATQVTGLATVATSGSYTDLTDTPAEYVLPTATETVLGGVKIGTGVAITDGVISVSTDYAATSHTHGIINNDGTASSGSSGDILALNESTITTRKPHVVFASTYNNLPAQGLTDTLYLTQDTNRAYVVDTRLEFLTLYLRFVDGLNTGGPVSDASPIGRAITNPNSATITNAQSVFDGASLYFSSAAHSIGAAYGSSDFLGNDDFFISFWIRPTAALSQTVVVGPFFSVNFDQLSLRIDSSGLLRIHVFPGGFIGTGAELTLNTWQHVVLERYRGVLRLYLNGTATDAGVAGDYAFNIEDWVLFNATYSNVAFSPTKTLYIGGFVGYLDNFRIAQTSYSGGTSFLSANDSAGPTVTKQPFIEIRPKFHSHGNITSGGGIGSDPDKIVVTTLGGILTTSATIAASSVSGLATVATSGSYADLTNLPTLFDGAYSSLTGAPSLATVATSGSYADLSGTPSLATVATSGSYNDLTSLPTLFDGAYSSLSGAPSLATVATSGSYNDLANLPALFDGAYSSLSGAPSLATVATSGSYADLSGTPSLATVATSGSYNDLTSLPTLFDGAYSSLSGAPSLATVATSGSYADLSGTPSPYSLPTATNTVLGGVKIGSGVSIDGDGVISVSTSYAASSHTHAASDITSGTIDTARLGSGTANSSTFLRGDGTWAAAGSTSASDLTSGTLSDARLSTTAQNAINLHPFLLAGM